MCPHTHRCVLIPALCVSSYLHYVCPHTYIGCTYLYCICVLIPPRGSTQAKLLLALSLCMCAHAYICVNIPHTYTCVQVPGGPPARASPTSCFSRSRYICAHTYICVLCLLRPAGPPARGSTTSCFSRCRRSRSPDAVQRLSSFSLFQRVYHREPSEFSSVTSIAYSLNSSLRFVAGFF